MSLWDNPNISRLEVRLDVHCVLFLHWNSILFGDNISLNLKYADWLGHLANLLSPPLQH